MYVGVFNGVLGHGSCDRTFRLFVYSHAICTVKCIIETQSPARQHYIRPPDKRAQQYVSIILNTKSSRANHLFRDYIDVIICARWASRLRYTRTGKLLLVRTLCVVRTGSLLKIIYSIALKTYK